ncbi:hypothetical protein ACFV6E_17705 [Streptomyces sp. NPDC059785]|uniref:hypothetical protein n=1 Tax=Streptomyces sp. NPDC059785 TaxID=3346945 RepID=UPI00364A625F
MTHLIRRLTAWVSLLLTPRGTHRRTARHRVRPVAPPRPAACSPSPPSSLPPHRSPYGLDTPLDGAATKALRPYLAHLVLEVAA